MTKFTPRLLELTYIAALNSFWRKNALRKFLRASHVSDNFISTWAVEESKREFLDRLFEKLQQTDKGKAVIFHMAKNLSEQTTFPDLRNWEDSSQKIQDAYKAVNELKYYLKKQEEVITSEKERQETQERAKKVRENMQKSLIDKAKLQHRLDNLHSLVGTQEGGYKFQDWFYDLLDYSEITNRRPYISNGRQIDGSLTLDGTTYLVELKFTSSQSEPSDIDSLRSKVEDKADNTMGIFVSISGYTNIAKQQASGRRSMLLLLDAQHVYMCLSGILTFSEIISRIRRHASQTGEAYLPIDKFSG